MKRTFNGTIEFYRYVFTFIVCLMHLYYEFWGKDDYLFRGGYISVDFFFILSGYFLPSSCQKHQSAYKYILTRYAGMFFIIISACIIGVLITSKGHVDEIPVLLITAIPEMVCLQMSGIFYPKFVGVMWYISAMMIAAFFISNLYHYHGNKRKFVELIAPAFVVGGYAYIYHNTGNLDSVGKDEAEILPLGLIRAFSGMSLGIILSHVTISFGRKVNDFFQIISLGGIFSLVFLQDHSKLDFLSLFLCPVLILSTTNKESGLNRFTNKLGFYLSKYLGKQLTLSMYVYSALTYLVMGIFVDFVSVGKLISALIYIPILIIVGFIVCKLSSILTPKIK